MSYRKHQEFIWRGVIFLINGRDYSNFDRSKLASYWNVFFKYEKTNLAAITEKELKEEIDLAKAQEKPFIDSQQVINKVLTHLGTKHNFHRQFQEQFSGANPGSVLGMQLYTLVLKDSLDWIYYETQHSSHMFPHATYFIKNEKI